MPEICGPDGVRRDLDPVLWLNSQSEIDAETVEPDSGNFVLWEIVGSAHAPHGYSQYQNSGYVFHETNGVVDIYDPEEGGAWGYQKSPDECVVPNIYEPSYGYSAALVALDRWVTKGEVPDGHRADRTDGTLHWDEQDNLVGGVRSPLIDVPIAHYYAGNAPDGGDACGQAGVAPLVGATRMMSAAELAERYGSSEAYVAEFEEALDRAVHERMVLPEGARELRRRLRDSARWVADALGEPR